MNNPFWHGGAKFYFSTTPGEGAQSEEFIWDESWKFDGSQDSDAINPLFRQVLTARASILADGGQIIKSRYSRSNQWHKDYDPQFYAKQGSPSMFYGQSASQSYLQKCNEIEDAVLARFETSTQKRWNRQIRCIPNNLISDQATYVNLGSYGPFNGLTPVVDKGPLPALQLVPRVIPTSPVINLTAVDGAITAAVIVTGGTGITSSIVYPHGDASYDWYWPVLGDDCVASVGSNGVVSVRVVGGVVTAINVVAGGSGYVAAPVWTPKLGTDPFTLQPYQWYEELLVNYVSTVAQNCIECKPVRLNPGSPPGKSNYLIVDGSQSSSIYFGSTANRFMFPRTTSRQTGAGNANKKGRHKVGI